MAQQLLSPGVFTNEIDQSFLAAGVANIGGAIVGPFPSGPAFAPTVINNQTDLQNIFGTPDGTYYGPYTAQQYLAAQGQVTIVRVGGLGGYIQNNPVIVKATRGQYARAFETAGFVSYCFSGSVYTGSSKNYSDGGVNGFFAVRFSDGEYSGSVFNIGYISGSFQTGSVSQSVSSSSISSSITNFYGLSYVSASVSQSVTSSYADFSTNSTQSGSFYYYLGLNTIDTITFDATHSILLSVVSQSTVNTSVPQAYTFGSASVALDVINDNTLQFSGSLVNATLFTTPQGKLRLSGSLSGNYGPFDPTSFDSSSFSRADDLVLAVLANTAYDESQNLWGFDGSVLTPSTTASLTLNYGLNLVEQTFSEAQGGQSSSYGNYNFSLDRGSAFYITNVFGTDPKAGIAPIPVGYKPKAAYVYASFPATIDDVAGQLLQYGWWKIEVETADAIVENPNVIDCVPEALDPQTEFVTSFALQFSDGVAGGGSDTEASSAYDIREAVTPWVISQNTSPDPTEDVRYELFRVHTISDGTNTNTMFKVEISNIKLAGTVPGSNYGSFTFALRAFDDTDNGPDYIETYTNATLDPSSPNFIARLIGDTYVDINFSGKTLKFGTYPAQSKNIRIEMAKEVAPINAAPFGFEAYATPIGGAYAENIPAMAYTSASIYSLNVGQYASGIDFNGPPVGANGQLTALYPATNSFLDNQNFFAPIPVNSTIGNNVPFSLDKTCGLSPIYNAGTERQIAPARRFVFGFQGGFDGQSPSVPIFLGDDILPANQQGLDCSSIVSSGSVGYAHCIGALSNADDFDINLLVTPGINYQYHPYVAELGLTTCQNRGDAFYILDLAPDLPAGGDSVPNIVELAAQFDTNYAASYYPWIKIKDTNTNLIIPVPPSVVLPAVYAANDAVAAEWFAPAGLNRGGITQAVDVQDRLTHSERDALYEGKVNAIASFPGQGIVVWGQKTLQNKPSALDRINVRRLLISLKKFIASSSRYLVFEQNVTTTRNKFLNIVNPYLESVQQRSGLYAFKVVCDTTNNTADVIDQNILYGQIYIQPTKTAEFVKIDFNVQSTGATFPSGT